MFRFLFKRAPKREPVPEVPPQKPEAANRADMQRLAREAALARAESLAGDEAAAVAFILESEHADARLKAAQHLHERQHLEKVRDAMRNTDRRVAKLMQQRLDQQAKAEALAARAGTAAEQAERLAAAPQLMVNQVSELDRAWTALGEVPEALRQRFDASRAILGQRLQAQASLQRAVLDLAAELSRLHADADAAANAAPPEQVEQSLSALEARMAAHLQSPEAASLPRARLEAVEQEAGAVRALLAQAERRRAAAAEREAALAGWEAAERELAAGAAQSEQLEQAAGPEQTEQTEQTEQLEQPARPAQSAQLDDAELRRAWMALPALSAADAPELFSRFDALLARVRAARKPKEVKQPEPAKQAKPPKPPKQAEPDAEGRKALEQAMAAMEEALEAGALHAAAEQDKAVRAMDFKAIRPSEAQLSLLSRLRAELARLQSWARWGGSVSREELLKAAQDMQGQDLPLAELAKKVGSLRERWKELDAASGPAGKDAWLRFDAACNAAYAPVAEYFREQAEERRQNLERARAFIAELREYAQSLGLAVEDGAATEGEVAVEVDWKALAAYCNQAGQAWRRMGPIDRRERKAADAEFAAALQLLTGPLAEQQRREIERRVALIAEVEALDANAPRATDALRAIQERWQEMARQLPLPRADEQSLWQRFRHACDALFAERREAAKVADAERQQNLERKEALCAALEAAAEAPVATLSQLLRDSEEAWRAIGPAPRAAQERIEARYDAAAHALRQRLAQAKEAQSQVQAQLLRDKLGLCRQAEALPAAGAEDRDGSLRAAWEGLPALPGAFERALRARFEAALSGAADMDLRAALERNHEATLEDILRLEILLGVDSPPALSQQRLKAQVQVLQSSLRSGQRPESPQALLLQLCSRPARLDEEDAARVERLIPLAMR